jgi:hypothetical protein
VALVLLLAGISGAAAGQDLAGLTVGEITSGPSVDHSGAWDEIDAQVDLTGLWGSIDPYLDGYPSLYTRGTDGTLFLTFSKWNGLFYEVVYAWRAAGESWSPLYEVQSVPDTTLDNITPRMVSDLDGYLHMVWARVSGSGSSVYHAVELGGVWTAPTRLSGMDNARRPVPRIDDGRTLVKYRTPLAIVAVEVIVYVSSGGTDDIDPGSEGVQVDHHEVDRRLAIK